MYFKRAEGPTTENGEIGRKSTKDQLRQVVRFGIHRPFNPFLYVVIYKGHGFTDKKGRKIH